MNSFKDFLIDEQEGEKKRKKIAATILKIVKKKLISKDETDTATFLKFSCDGEIKETICEVVIAIDYFKRYARGMTRAVYVTISKETNSHRDTNYLTIEVDRVSDVQFAQTIESLKNYFSKMVDKK